MAKMVVTDVEYKNDIAMKRIIIILFFIVLFNSVRSQVNNSISKDISPNSYTLSLKQDNTFEVYLTYKESPEKFEVFILKLRGTIKKKGNVYELYDTETAKRYHIKKINNEKLLNIDLPYLLKDTLYSSFIRDEKYIIIGDWKNRKKDGLWTYISNKSNSPEKLETYKDGKLIKVTYLNK